MIYDVGIVKEWVGGVLRGIYAPEPEEEVWEWAERTMRIPAGENEEKAGMLWSSADSPYVRELLEWARRPGKGEFWIVKSSQVGVTMAILILICWMIVHRPGNIIYAIDSKEEAVKISRTRLKAWITDNRLLEKIQEDEDALSNLTYYLRGMTVYMMGAYSKGGWANKSVVLCILDELDKHPYIEGEGTTVTLARERVKRPRNAKIIGFSTPGAGDWVTSEWKKGTQEEVRFAFPCGHVQALKWQNLIFGTKEFKDLADGYDLEKVERDAYFRCEHELCNGRLYDTQKRAAMQTCQYVATNPKASRRVRSVHLWDAYSMFVSFGEIALKWIEAQGKEDLLERFMRGTRGEQHVKDGRKLEHEDILNCRGNYLRGECPLVPLEIYQAIDIQGDVQKAVKVAVDEKHNFWVIDWFMTLSLRECVEWVQEPVKGPDGQLLYATGGFIDEGHRANDVREICLDILPDFEALGLVGFWPVKGLGGIQVKETITTSPRWVKGEELTAYHIAEDQFKWQLLHMITKREKRMKKGEPLIWFPSDAEDDDDLVAEMCGERPVKKASTMGKEKWEWKKEGPNDYWDCVKYCLAVWTVRRPELVKQGLTR